jgi:hypothetical protein
MVEQPYLLFDALGSVVYDQNTFVICLVLDLVVMLGSDTIIHVFTMYWLCSRSLLAHNVMDGILNLALVRLYGRANVSPKHARAGRSY